MNTITIPAGLQIFDREIDIEIEYDPSDVSYEVSQVATHGPNLHIGRLYMTAKLIAALEAAAAYQASIGE